MSRSSSISSHVSRLINAVAYAAIRYSSQLRRIFLMTAAAAAAADIIGLTHRRCFVPIAAERCGHSCNLKNKDYGSSV